MKKLIALTLALSPLAAGAAQINTINNIIETAQAYGNSFITILISIAVIYIIFGVVRYLIAGSGDPEKRKQGRDTILWGVVGLFVILSIWGLVGILKKSFATDTRTPTEQFPSVNVKVPNQ